MHGSWMPTDATLLRERELGVVYVRVEAATREQFVVRAAFDDVAVLHDEDHVGVTDRRETMRDDE